GDRARSAPRPGAGRGLHRLDARPAARLRACGVRRSALQPPAQRQPAPAEPQPGRRRGRRLGQLPGPRRLRRLHPRLARGSAAGAAEGRHHLGDGQLPQRLPPGRRAPGPRLLGAERHRLAQNEPDAELPRPAFHQRARDADLGGAGPGKPLPLQLRRHEVAERGPPDAERLAAPALHRAGAAAGLRRRQAPPDPEAGSAAAPGSARLHGAGRRGAGPVPRHRDHGGGGQAPRPALRRAGAGRGLRGRRRGADRRGGAADGSRGQRHPGQARTAAHPLRHAGGARRGPARLRAGGPRPPLERAGGGGRLSPLRPGAGIHPPRRRAGAGSAELQRLDLLARGDARRPAPRAGRVPGGDRRPGGL
ncbi:MAG: Type II restriction adenine-specific methylase, partial [uncultured Acetobacteraceae bacterium]